VSFIAGAPHDTAGPIPIPMNAAPTTGLSFGHEQLSPAEKAFLEKAAHFAETEVAP
jgi:hypothetical protein